MEASLLVSVVPSVWIYMCLLSTCSPPGWDLDPACQELTIPSPRWGTGQEATQPQLGGLKGSGLSWWLNSGLSRRKPWTAHAWLEKQHRQRLVQKDPTCTPGTKGSWRCCRGGGRLGSTEEPGQSGCVSMWSLRFTLQSHRGALCEGWGGQLSMPFFGCCCSLAVLNLHCCRAFFSSCDEQRLLFGCSARAPHCRGFSCWGAGLWGTWAHWLQL